MAGITQASVLRMDSAPRRDGDPSSQDFPTRMHAQYHGANDVHLLLRPPIHRSCAMQHPLPGKQPHAGRACLARRAAVVPPRLPQNRACSVIVLGLFSNTGFTIPRSSFTIGMMRAHSTGPLPSSSRCRARSKRTVTLIETWTLRRRTAGHRHLHRAWPLDRREHLRQLLHPRPR